MASKALTHREACYELRRTAKLLGDEKINLDEWYQSVRRILAARSGRALAPRLAPPGARA